MLLLAKFMKNTYDELLLCFDDAGRLIAPQRRQIVHTRPLQYWHGVANIIVINNRCELLTTLRSANCENHPGKWQVYVGGHVKAGNSFIDQAVTELAEEIGLHVARVELKVILRGKHEASKHFFTNYMLQLDSSPDLFNFVDGEIAQSQWLTLAGYAAQIASHPEHWCNPLSLNMAQALQHYFQH